MRTQVPHLESPVSFVDHQGNKQWVWLALDSKTREIVGVTIGDWLCHCAERNRSEQAAPELWNSLPPVYRLIFGQLMRRYFLNNPIKQWEKKQEEQVILNGLTILLDKEYLD